MNPIDWSVLIVSGLLTTSICTLFLAGRYRELRRYRISLNEDIEKAERELIDDIVHLGEDELKRTGAGRELLEQFQSLFPPPKKRRFSPFITFRPVTKEYFSGRTNEIQLLFDQIAHSKNTLIIGGRRIGKTSLLINISDPKIYQTWLNSESDEYAFIFLDSLRLSQGIHVHKLWINILRRASEIWDNSIITKKFNLLAEGGDSFSIESLEEVFDEIKSAGKFLVLLFDDIEVVLHNNYFIEFWNHIQSLIDTSYSLCYVASSRLGLDELANILSSFKADSIVMSTTPKEIWLKTFSDEEAKQFIANSDPDGYLTLLDRQFILSLSGHHPFILQLIASVVWDRRTTEDRQLHIKDYAEITEQTQSLIEPYFDSVWSSLNEDAKIILASLALQEVGKAERQVSELVEKTAKKSPRLIALLESNGIVRRERKRYYLASKLFSRWILDELIDSSITAGAQVTEGRISIDLFNRIFSQLLNSTFGSPKP